MTDPATPGQEGPSYGPPPLPEGWIAQWDGVSKKYYFVQLSTGEAQWETPTHAAPTVGTPTATPAQESSPFPQPGQQQEIDQGGPDGERGLVSMAVNQLLPSQGGGQSGKQSNPLLNGAGKIIRNIFDQRKHPASSGPPEGSYGQSSGFIGSTSSGLHNKYGYSEGSQQSGGYTGQAPPSSYQPTGGQGVQSTGSYYNPPYAQHPSESSNVGTSSYYGQQSSQPQRHHHQEPFLYEAPQKQYPAPIYIGPAIGNPEQPQQQKSQGLRNASHQSDLYGVGSSQSGPPPPMGSHPNYGQQGGYGRPGQGQGW